MILHHFKDTDFYTQSCGSTGVLSVMSFPVFLVVTLEKNRFLNIVYTTVSLWGIRPKLLHA